MKTDIYEKRQYSLLCYTVFHSIRFFYFILSIPSLSVSTPGLQFLPGYDTQPFLRVGEEHFQSFAVVIAG